MFKETLEISALTLLVGRLELLMMMFAVAEKGVNLTSIFMNVRHCDF